MCTISLKFFRFRNITCHMFVLFYTNLFQFSRKYDWIFQPSIDSIVLNKSIVLIKRYRVGFSHQTIFSVFSLRLVIHQIMLNYLLPLDWTSWSCVRLTRSPWVFLQNLIFKKRLIQNQSCVGWRNLILPQPPSPHSRFRIRSFIHIAYDPNNPDHQYWSRNAFTSATGARRLRGSFSLIPPKVSCCSLSLNA